MDRAELRKLWRQWCEGPFSPCPEELQGFLTPEDVHYGRADQIIKERQAVLMAAYEIHPKRFKGKMPKPADLPPAVWINKPALPNSDPALH